MRKTLLAVILPLAGLSVAPVQSIANGCVLLDEADLLPDAGYATPAALKAEAHYQAKMKALAKLKARAQAGEQAGKTRCAAPIDQTG